MLMTQLFRENLENIGEPKNIRDSTLNGFRWSSVGAGLSRMAASAWSRFGNGLVTVSDPAGGISGPSHEGFPDFQVRLVQRSHRTVSTRAQTPSAIDWLDETRATRRPHHPSFTPNMENEPNIRTNFGSPVVFFDSHPEEQESYLYSYWSSLKSSLKIAWTGDVPKFHETGVLRLYFYTQEGRIGHKDYELREYEKVRADWHKALELPEVRRAVVMGYSGQNPYTLGRNPWREKFEREQKLAAKAEAQQKKQDALKAQRKKDDDAANLIDFDDLIAQTEEAEEQREIKEREREREGSSEHDRLLDV
ncbi:hypothetical protein B2J93_4932 [Marssonina coronariae]|uniref:Uncharacterized protein n=1 Tax=Diplocarpon coronariae TaxID=2795749 RepID=A0A218ZGM8_9HELO|nr:hypothetical protein B2J93_4932 [Marssonina coronariae]